MQNNNYPITFSLKSQHAHLQQEASDSQDEIATLEQWDNILWFKPLGPVIVKKCTMVKMTDEIFPFKADTNHCTKTVTCHRIIRLPLSLFLFSETHSSLGLEEAKTQNLLNLSQLLLRGRPSNLQPNFPICKMASYTFSFLDKFYLMPIDTVRAWRYFSLF